MNIASSINESIVSNVGRLARLLGYNDIMARLYSTLLLSRNPLSIDDLVNRLKVSKGAVSINLRALERWGMSKEVKTKEEKRRFYRADFKIRNILRKGKYSQMMGLEITSHIGCKIMCTYCPQILLGKQYKKRDVPDYLPSRKFMSLDTFKQAVDKLPSDARIVFSGFAEPWLNPDCEAMVHYAYETGHPIRMFTTLAGLTEENLRNIEHIPFERFDVHLADTEGLMRIQVDGNYLSVLKTLLNSEIEVSKYMCIGKPHPAWKSLLTDQYVDTQPHDRAGNVAFPADAENVERLKEPLKGSIYCSKFPELDRHVMLPNGDLALCCQDYGLDHIVGNLLTQSYEQVRQGAAFKAIKQAMDDDSMDILCRSCVMARPTSKLAHYTPALAQPRDQETSNTGFVPKEKIGVHS